MPRHVEPDKRFAIANKEALFCLLLTIANFIWWYGFAYGLGSAPVKEFTYILGLPSWFFLSCVAGFPVFAVLAWLMVRFVFTDIPLDPIDPQDEEGYRP